MSGRSHARLTVPQIRALLQIFLGIAFISLAITAVLLSITLFVMRNEGHQQLWRIRETDEDGMSCKKSGDDITFFAFFHRFLPTLCFSFALALYFVFQAVLKAVA